MHGLRRAGGIGWAVFVFAIGIAVAAVATVMIAALRELPVYVELVEPAMGDSLGSALYFVARSFALRQAITNTLMVAVLIGAMLLVLNMLLSRHRRVTLRPWQTALLVTPLFLPVPVAALLWRPIFAPIDYTHSPKTGLLLIAAVLLWRLWSLTLVAMWLGDRLARWRTALAVSLVGVWLVLVDVGTPLLVTGGMPYGDTHLWSTWAFTLLQMALEPVGGIIAASLALGAAGIGIAIWLLIRPVYGDDRVQDERLVVATPWIAGVGIAAVLLPIVLAFVQVLGSPIVESVVGLLQAGFVGWMAWSLALALLATALAGLIAVVAARVVQDGSRWPAGVGLTVGMGVVPIWYWFLHSTSQSGGTAFLASVVIVTTGLSAGLIVASLPRYSSPNGRSVLTAALAVAVLISGLQFPLDVLVAQQSRLYTVGAGLALTLAGDAAAQPITQLAALLVFALVYALVYVVLRWQRQTATVVPQPTTGSYSAETAATASSAPSSLTSSDAMMETANTSAMNPSDHAIGT